jgi:hypothetical protein
MAEQIYHMNLLEALKSMSVCKDKTPGKKIHVALPKICFSIYIYTHTHTHTHIYIYICSTKINEHSKIIKNWVGIL